MKRRLHIDGLEERTVPAVAIDSAYEVYAWNLINELRANPTAFANNIEGLVNNSVNSAFGFSRTDAVIADLRAAIDNAGGTASLYDESLALMRATAAAGPLAWSDELETRANNHNDWMRTHGFAHTNTGGSGPAIPGYTATAGSTDTWGTYGTFTGFGENIGYNVGGLLNSKAALNAGTFNLAGFQQRAAFLDTVGYLLELNSGSLGHLRNLLGRDNGAGGSLPAYNTIGLDVDLYQAPSAYEVQDSVPEAWISTHRVGFNDPAGNGGYVVGMVYRDANTNGFFDVGEQVDATVDVRTSGGVGFTDSLLANTNFGAFSGYVANGTYTVTVTVNGAVVGTQSVTINNNNGLAEFALANDVTLTGPASTVSELRPTATWNAVPGATGYQVVLNNRTTNASNLFPNTTTSNSTWTPPADLIAGHGYRVSVRAVLAGGAFGPWSNRDFAVNAPTVTAPTTTTTNLRPTVSWTPITGAASYGIWFNDLSDAKSNIYPGAVVSGTSWSPPTDLVSGRNYRVWVKAINDVSQGAWSTPKDFSVGRPTVLTPTGTNTNLRPLVSWTAITGATKYQISVTNTTTNTANIFPSATTTNTNWTPTGDLISGNNYRVWVRALNGNNLGLWSPAVNFTVGKPTITPISSTSNLQPTFSWTPISGASSYEIWFNDVSTSKSNIYPGAKVNSTNWSPPTNLVSGRTYRIWVRALNSANAAVWSTPITFTVS